MKNSLEKILKDRDNPEILTYSVIYLEDGLVNVTIGGGMKRSKHYKKKDPEDLKLIAQVLQQIDEIKEHYKRMKRKGEY